MYQDKQTYRPCTMYTYVDLSVYLDNSCPYKKHFSSPSRVLVHMYADMSVTMGHSHTESIRLANLLTGIVLP